MHRGARCTYAIEKDRTTTSGRERIADSIHRLSPTCPCRVFSFTLGIGFARHSQRFLLSCLLAVWMKVVSVVPWQISKQHSAHEDIFNLLLLLSRACGGWDSFPAAAVGREGKKCNCVVLLLVILSLPCSFAFSLVPIHTIQLKLNYIGLHSSSLAFFPFFALLVHYFYVCKAWEIVLDAKNGCTVDGLDCQL